jgi:hypothetical protein
MEELDEIQISVPLDKFLDLLVLEHEHNLLLDSGVDNWDGFEDAYEDYDEEALRKELLEVMGFDSSMP